VEAAPAEDAAPPIAVLVRRGDFVAASRALRQPRTGLMLQGRRRAPGEADGVRVGFTCSKKVGNAVARNRAKRRLRAAARAVLPRLGRAGWDYVLIGRNTVTAQRPFPALCDDLAGALEAIHGRDR
jgi:ribonuclease P protein component